MSIKITEKINSPNQSSRYGYIPQLIVCHIADGTYGGTKEWFLKSASATSSHFIVAQDGRICQCVGLDKMAWCNGTSIVSTNSKYYGRSTVPLVKKLGSNANLYSISIEHEGYHSKTKGALTPAQLEATVWLIKHIQANVKSMYGFEIPLSRTGVVGHNEINPVTKPLCPGERFQWSEIISKLSQQPSINKDDNILTQTDDGDITDEIAKGDIVQFLGGNVFKSSGVSISAGTRNKSKCEVTLVSKSAAHPYHLISVDDGTVYGWVNVGSFNFVNTEDIHIGSIVKISGDKYATGTKIPEWVKATEHKVSQLKGDRVLLGANGGINSWLLKKDLYLK